MFEHRGEHDQEPKGGAVEGRSIVWKGEAGPVHNVSNRDSKPRIMAVVG